MYNNQTNGSRLIYTINDYIEADTTNTVSEWCYLKNGFCFTKVARSDEKVRYTESDMHAIIRTVLFIEVFRIGPNETLLELINTGQVSYPSNIDYRARRLTLRNARKLLDSLFGDQFSVVVRRVLLICYHEYQTKWQYYPFVSSVAAPSASDVIKMCRFVNATTSRYSNPTQFLVNNSVDHKIYLQSQVKYLKS